MTPFQVGEQVTILPPYDDDLVIIQHQHYGRIAEARDGQYLIELESSWPPRSKFGPFPEGRLARGWRNGRGQWLAER